MTTLFESKLESLPEEIKSTYPPLQQCNLDDVNPVFSSNIIQNEQNKNNKEGEEKKEDEKKEEKKNEEEQKEEEQKEEEKKQEELTPEEELENFLKENEDYRRFVKQLKIGIKSYQIEQKERINGLDMDIFNEMLEKAKKVYPKIS